MLEMPHQLPSRQMPAYRDQPPQLSIVDHLMRTLGILLLLAIASILIYYITVDFWVRLGFTAFILFTIFLNRQHTRHIKHLAQSRPNDSICTFARAFDYRNIDTWIIRAVYEQVQPWASVGKASFPLRPADRLSEDFGIVGEDLDELADEISTRTGRTWENCEHNPYYGKVKTVGDLVMFFAHQPRQAK